MSPVTLVTLLLLALGLHLTLATALPPTTPLPTTTITEHPLIIPPPIPNNPRHPLLSTIHYPTSITDVQPGRLNHYNFTRPEGTRQFYLYVPSTYTAQNAWPFTFYFHGFQGDWQQGVQLNQTVDAETFGYLIAFGQGTRSSMGGALGWNAGVCCLFNGSSIVDDVQFAREVIKMVQSAVNVDSSRIYTTGWSNGGYMSERLACEAGELFAGVCADASAVGILPGGQAGLASCDKSFGTNRLNYLHFHATADTVVPWTGLATTPSALLDISRWTRRLQCGPHSDQTYNDGTFSNLAWADCRDGREVEFMSVRGAGHWWWTAGHDGFSTMAYAMQFFTRTWKNQNAVAAGQQAEVLMA